MDHPSRLFQRIRRQQARPALPRRADAPPPCSAPAPTVAPANPSGEGSAPVPSPRPARGHTLYSQIMRNHDRMGTRHL